MPMIALFLFLSISALTTPVFGQGVSDEARFSTRAMNLRMSEKMLTSRLAKPDKESLAIAAIQLREFEADIKAFQAQGRDLSTFLFLEEWDSSNRRAIAGGVEEFEEVVDRLIDYFDGSIDDVVAAQEAAGSPPTLLGQLSREWVRILPRLERVALNAKQNLIDVRMQREILEEFGTVKRLCRLLKN